MSDLKLYYMREFTGENVSVVQKQPSHAGSRAEQACCDGNGYECSDAGPGQAREGGCTVGIL